ncbi:Eyes absent-like protein 4 [Hordeum vulgare]|nr:Eyes absent-like protein 4 [Hordeum vulgare]
MTTTAVDETTDRFKENIIFQGGAVVACGQNVTGYDLDETQSQDDRGLVTYEHAAFMHDQIDLDVDGLPLDHEFPKDYRLEEEDELDIDKEPFFEEELANQADGSKPNRKSKHTKAYMAAEDKLLCECWRDIGQDPKVDAE